MLIGFITATVIAGCGDSYHHHESKKARVKEGAKDFGHKTEHAFRHVGHKMKNFFRGDD
jgi:hypothetical protein